MQRVECEVQCINSGVPSSVKSEVESVECKVWSVKCGALSAVDWEV